MTQSSPLDDTTLTTPLLPLLPPSIFSRNLVTRLYSLCCSGERKPSSSGEGVSRRLAGVFAAAAVEERRLERAEERFVSLPGTEFEGGRGQASGAVSAGDKGWEKDFVVVRRGFVDVLCISSVGGFWLDVRNGWGTDVTIAESRGRGGERNSAVLVVGGVSCWVVRLGTEGKERRIEAAPRLSRIFDVIGSVGMVSGMKEIGRCWERRRAPSAVFGRSGSVGVGRGGRSEETFRREGANHEARLLRRSETADLLRFLVVGGSGGRGFGSDLEGGVMLSADSSKTAFGTDPSVVIAVPGRAGSSSTFLPSSRKGGKASFRVRTGRSGTSCAGSGCSPEILFLLLHDIPRLRPLNIELLSSAVTVVFTPDDVSERTGLEILRFENRKPPDVTGRGCSSHLQLS